LSYCAEQGLTPQFYVEKLKSLSEPGAVCITNHGMALYFPGEIAWKWEFITDSAVFDKWLDSGNKKLSEHIREVRGIACPKLFVGIEVEMMNDGRLTFDPCFRDDLDIIIGSVHFLPVSAPCEDTRRRWLEHTLKLINSGIDILGHPFRWIRAQMPVREEDVRTVVLEAQLAGVALELNSHYLIDTDISMLRLAAELSAKIAIASDSHKKEDFGDYSYHKKVIKQSGVNFKNLALYKFSKRISSVKGRVY
jgi:histidinol phosphatase-like PHP family hydrolase